MINFRRFLIAAFLLTIVPGSPVRAEEPLRVFASFSVLADLVREVGGDHVVVTSMVPIGGEPHDWEPQPRDVAALGKADLVVVNGLGLEGWLDRMVAASGYEGPIVVASSGVTPILTPTGAADPHAWHSLAEIRLYLDAIADGLSRAAPDHAADFARQRDRYQHVLSVIGRAVDLAISMVPPERCVAYTTHAAFAYLERDHGIKVLSPAGPESSAEGSAKRLAELVGRIHETGAKAVFPETGGNVRLAHVLADEAGVEVGGALYAGTLSGPDGPASSFIDMWAHNVFLMLYAMTP